MTNVPTPLVATVGETCELTRLSRGTIYKMVAEGTLKSKRIGGRRLILRDSIASLFVDAA